MSLTKVSVELDKKVSLELAKKASLGLDKTSTTKTFDRFANKKCALG